MKEPPGSAPKKASRSTFIGRIEMAYKFADEAGNFDFTSQGSAYFIVTAVLMWDWRPAASDMLMLRHELARTKAELLPEGFHATDDKQAVRDRVFQVITAQDLYIHSVVLEKRKANPRIATDENYFYRLAWHYLFGWMAKKHSLEQKDVHVVASTLGTKKKLKAFEKAVCDVVDQHAGSNTTACWSAASHPCLQIADYCCWAIQRKYEKSDSRSYDIIKPKLRSCFELFNRGTKLHY